MRHKIISTLLILTLFIFVGSGFGQEMKKTGTSGAAILKVAVGAKAAALAGAMTTTQGDVNQLFWNPAGVVLKSGETQLTFSYNNWIADLNHNAFAVAHSFGNLGTIAIGGMIAGVGDIIANRDIQPGLKGVEYVTSETFDYNSNFIALSYARQFTDKLSLGLTAKYYSETIDGVGIHSFMMDFGAIYQIGFRDLTIGARIQNLGQDMSYYYVPIYLPLVFSFGASYSMINSDLFGLKGYVDAAKPLDADQMVLGGLEAHLFKTFFVRTGYKFNFMGTQDQFLSRSVYYPNEKVYRDSWLSKQTYNRTDEGISLGAGLDVPYSNYRLTIDYTWTKFDVLDDVNRFSLTFKF
ncbi:MAG: PorV/PorQ family protein [candidate division KSB1 bacterium]|nr:PorV/PorQ family protein [candidate division KSB1 bacterium]MDZ7336425.1 PorV/PorQ family protein [candidate division KSB1 bacterium]MDZ7358401.1 PorV/PorQ family protein [candidate division KSB1 bacterium]MDZ7376513.1 PorV/PorQ family protein [candidate division KSB1 bacterium]MDZ7399063.1 PorV/PorQ family protein [candidate division KSB1 bacterium]